MRAEVGNLAGVMRAALADRDAAAVTPLVAVLGGFWTIEGEHLTVLGLSRPVLELLVDTDTPEPGHEDELRGVLVAMIINATIFTGEAPAGAVDQLRALGVGTPGSRTAAMCRVLLDVYDSGDGDLTRIDKLTANEDPAVSRLALQWASQAKENAGDVAGAIEAGQLALERCDDSDGPWTRALICGQLCGLATQVGDWPLAVRYARESLPVMEALGAAEDAIQLRSVIALADLSAGRLDEAAEELRPDRRRRAHRPDDRLERCRDLGPGRAGPGARRGGPRALPVPRVHRRSRATAGCRASTSRWTGPRG